MTDDVEQLLGRLTPRGVRPELRPEVLAAVSDQLAAEPPARWLRRSALAVAAMVLLGIGLNVWANQTAQRRLARLFGPRPVSRQAMELAGAIEQAAGPEAAEWVQRQFAAIPESSNGLAAYAAYSDTVKRLAEGPSNGFKEPEYDNPEVDRSRPGGTDRDRSGCQRDLRLDHRYTA